LRDPAPPPRPVEVPLPAAVAEELIGYGLQTMPGKALWRGYLLGAGLPHGDGQIVVAAAHYDPLPPNATSGEATPAPEEEPAQKEHDHR
jgi:hypothetical protein